MRSCIYTRAGLSLFVRPSTVPEQRSFFLLHAPPSESHHRADEMPDKAQATIAATSALQKSGTAASAAAAAAAPLAEPPCEDEEADEFEEEEPTEAEELLLLVLQAGKGKEGMRHSQWPRI